MSIETRIGDLAAIFDKIADTGMDPGHAGEVYPYDRGFYDGLAWCAKYLRAELPGPSRRRRPDATS